MDHEAKQKHMKKVNEYKIQPSLLLNSKFPQSNSLEVSVDDCDFPHLPKSVLQGIWKKADELVHSGNDVIDVPWMKGEEKAKLVKSYSSEQPHLVKACGNQYKCDGKCEMFSAFSLCAHTVAAAQVNGDLCWFLEVCSQTFRPNLAAIAQ